jgi:hypothetical protein
MSWVFARPLLPALEIAWSWLFAAPFLLVCWMQAVRILAAVPPEAAGLANLDPQNPWVAAMQLSNAVSIYWPHLVAVARWLLPLAALAWSILSGLGRSLLLKRLEPRLPFRPFPTMLLQAAWLVLLAVTVALWLYSVRWAALTHIGSASEPDLIGFSAWTIFLSLSFFTAWALLSWPLSIAPLIALFERRSALSAIRESFRLGRLFTAKLIEINLVMGIVRLALIVVAMVISAAPLPFSDELGADAMHAVWALAILFFLVAGSYFQVVRLKGFVEFWRAFRG